MAEGDRPAVDRELAAVLALRAGQDVEQLVLALALERDDAEDLAREEVERDVRELRPGAQARGRMRGARRAAAARRSAPVLGRPGRHALDDVAEHQRDDPLLGALVDVDDADRLAFAQDGRPVAHGGDLDHAGGR